jgi:hypothetical protein
MGKNGFISVLDKIGDGIKWFFTNPVAVDVEDTGISIVKVAFPALTPLLTGIGKSLATAQGLANSAKTAGDTTAQVTALVLSDAQQVFSEYETATGTTIEPAKATAIINAYIALLDEIPGAVTTTPAASTAAAPAVVEKV